MTAYPDFHPPASFATDSGPHELFKEDETTVLDDGILEGSGEPREMFGGDFADPDSNSIPFSNPFQKPNPFAFAGSSTAETWTSGSCTPTVNFDNFAVERYDGDAANMYMTGSAVQASGSTSTFDMQGMNQVRHNSSTFPSASSTTTVSFPPSPLEGGQEWMPSSSSDQTQVRSISGRRRPGSPLRPHSPLVRRGDGIRKKNARFEIPAERNLHNIDHFIAQSSDDQEIKELKQQKRLLRNRQAAYEPPASSEHPFDCDMTDKDQQARLSPAEEAAHGAIRGGEENLHEHHHGA